MSEQVERSPRTPIAKGTNVTVVSTGRRMKVWRDMGDLNIICYSYQGNEFAELHTLDNLVVSKKS